MDADAPHELLYDVLRHVRPLHQYSAKVVADAQQDSAITMPLRAVLERLSDHGPATVPQIARALWVARQAVQRLVNDAMELGLVHRIPNPAHRRSLLIELTADGRAAFDEIRDREAVALRAIAADLDAADIAACVRVVRHLTVTLRRVAEAGPTDQGWPVPGPHREEDLP